jgi:DNA-binding transcriptional LysR family regulator
MIIKRVEWDKLKTFYHVTCAGSFLKASQILNLSQSALSRQVAKLEYQVGKPLLKRSVKGLILTDIGQEVFNLSKRVLTDIEVTSGKISEEENEPCGELKISCTNSLASTWLIHYLTTFLEKYPRISVSVIATDDEPNLSTCEVDVAIRTALPERPDLIQEKLRSFQVKLFASKNYLKKYGTPTTVDDLKKHRIITYGSYHSAPYENVDWTTTIEMPIGQVRSSILKINSSLGMYHAANEGLGIVSFSEGFENFPTYKNSQLIPVLPDIYGPKVDRYFIYSSQQKNSLKIKKFLEHIKESIAITSENNAPLKDVANEL